MSTPVNLSTSDIFRETENKQFNLFSNQELAAPDLTFHDYNGLNKFGIKKVIEIIQSRSSLNNSTFFK